MAVFWKTVRQAGACAATVLAAQQAQASGTAAGSTVTNTATVNYQIGGVSAPAVQDDESFVVDRRISFTVAEVGGATHFVPPGAVDKPITFTLTNSSNAPLDFALTADQVSTSTTVLGGGDDDFDPLSVRIFLETGTVAGFDATDQAVAHVDNLLADTSRTIYIVANIPDGQAIPSQAGLSLRAVAHENDNANTLGAVVTATVGADTAGMDTVFGDTAGFATGDAARDGQHSDDGSYFVDQTTLEILKTSRVVSDPINGTTDPKAIPGATIEYCLILRNTGSQNIASAIISDPLPTETGFVAGSLRTNVTIDISDPVNPKCAPDTGDAEDDDNLDGDETPNGASYVGASRTVAGVIGTIAGGTRTGVRFHVTIN